MAMTTFRKSAGLTFTALPAICWSRMAHAERTIEKAEFLEERARKEIGPVPFVFVMNKCDLVDEWEIDPEMEARLAAKNWTVLRSSAKTGQGVDEAFLQLTRKIVG